MEAKEKYLVLEDGAVFTGKGFGAEGDAMGEIVFSTGMTGYLETLTDPSYYGQLVVQTFPIIGNYGVIPTDFESGQVHFKAYIVRDWCEEPSNFRAEGDLSSFLKDQGVVGLYGIDTRKLTRIIREHGVMNALITDEIGELEGTLRKLRAYRVQGAVEATTSEEKRLEKAEGSRFKVVLWDFGAKGSIARQLLKRGCDVLTMPATATAAEILAEGPDGVMLSNGPGDPAENTAIIKELGEVCKSGVPIFGICLGHQLLALAMGGQTVKLKYGHRGGNQPAKDVESERIFITSQNHGYAVDTEDLPENAKLRFVNVNDGTCEGLDYLDMPAFSVQFHPEAASGPHDTRFLFDRFIGMMESHQRGRCKRGRQGTLSFVKMQGCGNDYIYFDCFHQAVEGPEELSRLLSHRHFGVGGDGIVLVLPSEKADAKMRIFNADGSEAMMCGNGIRCVGKLLYDRGHCQKETLTVETASGPKTLHLHLQGGKVESVSVEMGRAQWEPARIPVKLEGEKVVGQKVPLAGAQREVTCVSMGNPHCILFGKDPAEVCLEELGPAIENDPIFPQRVNVEFVEVVDERHLRMRVWERGSGETYACGTGAAASVAAAVANGFCRAGEPVEVKLRGGALTITYTEEGVTMTGPAVKVFEGTIDLEEAF